MKCSLVFRKDILVTGTLATNETKSFHLPDSFLLPAWPPPNPLSESCRVRGSSYPRVTSGVSCPPLQVFPASPASTLSHAPRIRPRPEDATGFAHVSAGPGICPAHPAPQPGPSRLTRSPAPQPGPAHTLPRRTSREPHSSPGHSPTLPRRPFLVPRARPQLSTSPASTGRVHAELYVSQAPPGRASICVPSTRHHAWPVGATL